jgi:uncharacterized protein (TIGR03437 family)
MRATLEPFVVAGLCTALWPASLAGQVGTATILEIEMDNRVQYLGDVSDVSKLATDPNIAAPIPARNFIPVVILADIVAVNGQPAKGITVFHIRQINLRTAPNAGEAIADVLRNNVVDIRFEISMGDGTAIGTIVASGLGGGVAPPGAPMEVRQGNVAIVGGTGAFLGARGQVGQGLVITPDRSASMTEDPANRRRNGGGRVRYVLHLIPISRPEIVVTSSGPAVFHADFSPVTAARPAKSGEVLIVRVTGLGPTRPGIDPGQLFPLDALQEVNSPVDVTVNGKPAEVINKIGWPGLLDTYRLDFRVPDGTAAGAAAMQLTAAWIAGSSLNIPIQ